MKLQKKLLVAAISMALAGGAGVAFAAGTVGLTAPNYATEVAGTPLAGVATPKLTYIPGVAIAASTQFTIYIRLNGGAKWPTGADTTIAAAAPGYTDGTNIATIANVYQNGDVLALNYTAPSTSILASGQLSVATAIPNTIDLSKATALKSAGGTVTADFALVLNNTATATPVYPTSAIGSANVKIATSATAVTAKVVSSGAISTTFTPNAESARIDVSATPTLSSTTSGLAAVGTVSYGSITLTNATILPVAANGTDFDMASLDNVNFTVNGAFLPKDETFEVYSDKACSLPLGTAVKGTLNTAGTAVTVSIPKADLTAGAGATQEDFFCGTVATTNKAVIPATKPTIASVDQYIAAAMVGTDTGGSLYDLVANGASVQVPYYVPSANAPAMTFIRVINNSPITTAITATLTGQDGKTLGTGPLLGGTTTLAGNGGSATLKATQIESNMGVVLTASERPTLTLSASVPVGDLVVQALMSSANGGFTNTSAIQK